MNLQNVFNSGVYFLIAEFLQKKKIVALIGNFGKKGTYTFLEVQLQRQGTVKTPEMEDGVLYNPAEPPSCSKRRIDDAEQTLLVLQSVL